jgi:hypothetical protein
MVAAVPSEAAMVKEPVSPIAVEPERVELATFMLVANWDTVRL